MAYKRKRVYANASRKRGRFTRRKRTGRFRRRGNRANTSSWTMQTGAGKGLTYKSRKVSGRRWRSMLWRDTLAKTHYKSSGVGNGDITCATLRGSGRLTLLLPTFIGVPSPTTAFWTETGGLQAVDQGMSTDTIFTLGDLVIRGGQVGLTITCPDAITREINIRVHCIKTTKRPDLNIIPSTATYGSQLGSLPEFVQQVGKVLWVKEATLNNSYPSFTCVQRLRVQKIDQEVYATDFGSNIAFIVYATNLQTNDADVLLYTTWHDMSFSGDVIAET